MVISENCNMQKEECRFSQAASVMNYIILINNHCQCTEQILPLGLLFNNNLKIQYIYFVDTFLLELFS